MEYTFRLKFFMGLSNLPRPRCNVKQANKEWCYHILGWVYTRVQVQGVLVQNTLSCNLFPSSRLDLISKAHNNPPGSWIDMIITLKIMMFKWEMHKIYLVKAYCEMYKSVCGRAYYASNEDPFLKSRVFSWVGIAETCHEGDVALAWSMWHSFCIWCRLHYFNSLLLRSSLSWFWCGARCNKTPPCFTKQLTSFFTWYNIDGGPTQIGKCLNGSQ